MAHLSSQLEETGALLGGHLVCVCVCVRACCVCVWVWVCKYARACACGVRGFVGSWVCVCARMLAPGHVHI